MRVLGLDYGDKTVGVAITDALNLTTQPLETITRERPNELRKTLRRIAEIVEEKDVTEIVIGWPVHLDGSESERTERTKEFGRKLELRVSVPVFYQDERLTTEEASEILTRSGVKKTDEKTYIDQIAATIILDDYLSLKKEK